MSNNNGLHYYPVGNVLFLLETDADNYWMNHPDEPLPLKCWVGGPSTKDRKGVVRTTPGPVSLLDTEKSYEDELIDLELDGQLDWPPGDDDGPNAA